MCDFCHKKWRFHNHREAGDMGDNIPGGIVAAASKFSSHAHLYLSVWSMQCELEAFKSLMLCACVFVWQRTGCRWWRAWRMWRCLSARAAPSRSPSTWPSSRECGAGMGCNSSLSPTVASAHMGRNTPSYWTERLWWTQACSLFRPMALRPRPDSVSEVR